MLIWQDEVQSDMLDLNPNLDDLKLVISLHAVLIVARVGATPVLCEYS